MTTQGMKEEQAGEVASLIARALRERHDDRMLMDVSVRVSELAAKYTQYPTDFSGHV